MDGNDVALGTVLANALSAFERNELTDDETARLFRYLMKSGLIWCLRERYAKHAAALLNDGEIFHRECADL